VDNSVFTYQPRRATRNEKKVKGRYELVEVPTQTTVLVKDTKTEEVMDIQLALSEILNKLERIEKSVG